MRSANAAPSLRPRPVIKDGHLFLSLMADGGIYEFEPAGETKPEMNKLSRIEVSRVIR